MDELNGIDYLRKKLDAHRTRVLLRYEEYDQKNNSFQPGITIPPQLQMRYKAVSGWCSKAVDALADRLIFREFADDNFNLNDIFRMNNPDIFFDSAILSALISSCCFVYISKDDRGFPRLQVIEGANATGAVDPITGLLIEGYAVLSRIDGKPKTEAYFTSTYTEIMEEGKVIQQIPNPTGYPLLVPIIHRPDAVRPFGRSRITRAAMYYQKYAKRTLERSDISAEFYSWPQKYVVGLSQDAEPLDTWRATISSMLSFQKDESGDSPKLGQFTQQSMSPFTEQLRTAAAGFAGETGLTLDDLGFVSDNPSSSEAIKASHENLRIAVRKAQRCFGSGFLNVGMVAACLRDDFSYRRDQFYLSVPKWEPVFEPDSSQLAGVGDAMYKLQQSFPDYITEDKLRDLTGF